MVGVIGITTSRPPFPVVLMITVAGALRVAAVPIERLIVLAKYPTSRLRLVQ